MDAYTNTVGVRLLDLPFHLDREYSYYVPDTLCFSPAVGDFAVVPFGGANKKHIALITSVGKTNDYGKLKPVLAQNVCTYDVMNASALVMVENAENVLNTLLA